MKLKVRESFKLTEYRLRQFKENCPKSVRPQAPKPSLMMVKKVYEEIMRDEQKKMIEFVLIFSEIFKITIFNNFLQNL